MIDKKGIWPKQTCSVNLAQPITPAQSLVKEKLNVHYVTKNEKKWMISVRIKIVLNL